MSTLSDAPEQKARTGLRPSRPLPAPVHVGGDSWIIITVLLILLVATDFVAYLGWTLDGGTNVSTAGYVAMATSVLFSLIVGCGFVTLIFYSSRSGDDEPPALMPPENRAGSGQYRHATKGVK